MCIFIAGIQPKSVTVEDHPRMCQACGLYQARLKRVDHYFSLFFLPLFRVKKGEPFVECRSCGSLWDQSGNARYQGRSPSPDRCPGCGAAVSPEFRFCPSCGKELER